MALGPKRKRHPHVSDFQKYPWIIKLDNTKLYLEEPIIIKEKELRMKLNAFEKKDLDNNWGWFVYTTRNLTQHDFKILTHTKVSK